MKKVASLKKKCTFVLNVNISNFMKSFLHFLLFIPFFAMAQFTTNYDLFIQNDLNDWIPARMSLEEVNKEIILTIINAEENIRLKPSKITEDTTFYHFIDYNAEIAFTKAVDGTLTGYWINFESEPVKKRLIKADKSQEKVDEGRIRSANLNGNWKTTITRSTSESEAIIIFRQDKNKLYATIRTKAGDYRYLEGVINGVNFYLSSFSGNSVYYLQGKVDGSRIKGRLTGLKTNDILIDAVKDDNFELPDSKSLTKVVNDEPFNLDLKDELGHVQDFQKLTKNKVTIVSIFGTWCPNCVDEANYFNELQKKFPAVEIICVAFEATDVESEQQKRVQGFKKRKDSQLQFLIGGKASSEAVLQAFPMIDKLSGYPTSFLVDKDGLIQEVYTGFNGPATGVYYDLFKEELEGKIRMLLND